MRRSLLFSCALHVVAVAIVLATAPRRSTHETQGPVELAVDAAPPPTSTVVTDVEVRSQTGGGGPARPTPPIVLASARAHHRRPLAIRAVETAAPPAPEPAPGLAAPPVTEDGLVEVAP